MNEISITHDWDESADQVLSLPSIDDIEEASKRIAESVVRTPVFENQDVNEMFGGRLLMKSEMMQRTGSFKLRGAYNRIVQLNDAQRQRGVASYSSGNHGVAVAYAANAAKTGATIVMATDSPRMKFDRVRKLGASIVTYERGLQKREAVASQIAAEQNFVLVPPSEDRRVLAGAGTVALELVQQAKLMNAELDAVFVPCGGGGLTATTAMVMQELSPKTRAYAVEPDAFDDTKRSLEAGKRVANPTGRKTICDAIMTDTPGEVTFAINKEILSGGLSVSDAEVVHAMRVAFEHFKVVIEPGAAVGLAAVLSGKIDGRGQTVAVIATGGNVDLNNYCSLLPATAGSLAE